MRSLAVDLYTFSIFLSRNFPKVYRFILYRELPRSNMVIRSILLYCYGVMLGVLFWRFVLLNVSSSFESSFYIGLTVTIFLGCGHAFSMQIRCISSLCLMGFLGKAGRRTLKAIVLSCILTGPINNISWNAREVVRVFTCSTIMAYNLSKVRFDLMTKPFQNALVGSKENLEQVKNEFEAMIDILDPIRYEVEGSNDTTSFERQEGDKNNILSGEEYQRKYDRKWRNRCEVLLERSVDRCVQAFEDAYDQCHDKLPSLVNTLLCWPLKIDFVCGAGSLFGDEGEICAPDEVIDPNFGQNYSQLRHDEQELIGNLKNVEISYEFVDMEQHSGYLTAKETSEHIVQQFEQKKSSFDLIVFILGKIFAFNFLMIIYGAARFHHNFLNKMQFENHYITKYFRHIDRRRISTGKTGIMPLRQIERLHIVDLDSVICTRMECRKIAVYLTALTLQALFATIFISIDRFFFETLDIVARHSRVDFTQEGYHDINITVTGTGTIATIVRRSVEGFNIHEKLKLLTSNEQCLPRPSSLTHWQLIRIYLMLFGVAILILNEAYINRFKRQLCAWFYPKREKQRILYLYNRMLKRRKGLLKLVMNRLREHIRKRKFSSRLDFLKRVEFYFPRCCGWLKYINKKTCSICSSNSSGHYVDCPNYKCFLVYCDECWQDTDRICLACVEEAHLGHDC